MNWDGSYFLGLRVSGLGQIDFLFIWMEKGNLNVG